MTDHIVRGRDEYRLRLKHILSLAKEAQHVVDLAYTQIEAQLTRPDYVQYGELVLVQAADTRLTTATELIDAIASECSTLSSATNIYYRREVRVGFPVGITHFTVDNGGTAGAGRVIMVGRNDTPTQLFESLFGAGDKVAFLASSKLAATDLNVEMTIASVSNNTIEFTTAFGTAPTAGNDYALHMILLSYYTA